MLLPSVRIGISTHLKSDEADRGEHEDADGGAARVLPKTNRRMRLKLRKYTASSQPGPPGPGESLPGVVEPSGAAVLLSFLSRPSFAGCPGEPSSTKRRSRSCVVDRRVSQQPADESAPGVEPLEQLLEVRTGAAEGSEVRQKQRVRLPRQDAVGADAPGLEIDIGRRRRRQDVRPGAASDPGRVADEGDAARSIEVADVVRCVPGRLRDLELSPTDQSAVRRRAGP